MVEVSYIKVAEVKDGGGGREGEIETGKNLSQDILPEM